MSRPAGDRREQVAGPAGQHLAREPLAAAREVDHPDLAQRGGQTAIVADLLGELDRAAVRLLGAVEVDLGGRAAERFAQRCSEQRLAELEVRPELLAASPRSRARSRTRIASSAAASSSWLIRSADARRSWTSSSISGSPIASARAASSLKPVESLVGLAQGRVRVVARDEERPPLCRRRDDGQRLVDEPERLLGGVRGERRRRGLDGEPRGAHRVAGRERMLGEHRQPGRSGLAAVEQQVDDRRVDLPPTGHRQQVHGELADLLVGERVVRRAADGLRQQEPSRDRRARGSSASESAPWSAFPSPSRARMARRSRRLKLRPRIAASPSAARSGPGAARLDGR